MYHNSAPVKNASEGDNLEMLGNNIYSASIPGCSGAGFVLVGFVLEATDGPKVL